MSDRRTIALVSPSLALPRKSGDHSATVLRRSVVPIILVLLWTLLTTSGLVSDQVLPSPLAIGQSIAGLWQNENLAGHLVTSVVRVFAGASVGIAFGLVLGLVAGFSRIGEENIDVTVQMLRTIPFLALVPLFIVWFGIGEFPKVALIALASLTPMYINTAAGVRNVDARLVEAMQSYGLSGFRLVVKVILPLAAPSILTGLRFSLSTSVLVLIAAEQINTTQGLGYLVNMAQIYQRVDVILVCIIIYAVLGVVTDLLVRALEQVLLPWRTTQALR